ncbi:MAG: 8-amino-7-oxononanoate synthase [Actinomycetes bacterium]
MSDSGGFSESQSTLGGRLEIRQQALRDRGLERTLRARPATEPLVDLAGNDYLGLARDPRVVQAAVDAAKEWGVGSTGSRLVTGTTTLHIELEHELAALMGSQSALVFSSGYLANLGVLTALSDPGTLLLVDAHAHASLFDAARLSRGQVVVMPHNDVEQARRHLDARSQPRAILVTESVFSVDGDSAPLPQLIELCASTDAVLLVDEAHAIGALGAGRGLAFELGLAGHPQLVQTATLSKALGSQGGVVAGSSAVHDFLITRARPFVYDTGLALPTAGAARAAAQIVLTEPNRVDQLRSRVDQAASALRVSTPAGAVISIPVQSAARALHVQAAAQTEGVLVGAFRPPSVPDDISRIRVTMSTALGEDQLSDACSVLAAALDAK